jgi:hypothetical protein
VLTLFLRPQKPRALTRASTPATPGTTAHAA